jgi:hypothetical protein
MLIAIARKANVAALLQFASFLAAEERSIASCDRQGFSGDYSNTHIFSDACSKLCVRPKIRH